MKQILRYTCLVGIMVETAFVDIAEGSTPEKEIEKVLRDKTILKVFPDFHVTKAVKKGAKANPYILVDKEKVAKIREKLKSESTEKAKDRVTELKKEVDDKIQATLGDLKNLATKEEVAILTEKLDEILSKLG